MNFHQLEYFVATVEQGSFSSAAKHLYVSPQAVSKAIISFEKELKIELFIRKKDGIEPTDFASSLFDRVEEIVHGYSEIGSFAKRYRERGRKEGLVKLAITGSPFRGCLFHDSDFDHFKFLHPRIELSLFYKESGSCISALEESVVDAAITLGRIKKPGFCNTKLCTLKPQLMLPPNGPYSTQSVIRITDLKHLDIAYPLDLRHSYRLIAKHLESHGVSPHFVEVAPEFDDYKKFFSRRTACMLVLESPPGKPLFPNTIVKPLQETEQFSIPLYFTYHEEQRGFLIPNLELYLLRLCRCADSEPKAKPKTNG